MKFGMQVGSMSDARWYAVWPYPRSRSRSWALQTWKSGHRQKLSLLQFTMTAGNWPWILKLGHNIEIWSGRSFGICSSFCVTWLWTWHKRQLQRVDCHSRTGPIYSLLNFITDIVTVRTVDIFHCVRRDTSLVLYDILIIHIDSMCYFNLFSSISRFSQFALRILLL